MDQSRSPGRPRGGVPLRTHHVDDDGGFADVLGQLADEPIIGLDTEFHREKTYFPQLALVQLAWPGRIALVDPLSVDIAPLGDILAGPCTTVIHAAGQDLEVLGLASGTAPSDL